VYDLVKDQVTLVGVLENQNAFSINLWESIYCPEKKRDMEQLFGTRERKNEEQIGELEIKYKLLNSGGHNGAISSIETCLQRPILLTCSVQDQTVRIWDYNTCKCVLTKTFIVTQENRVASEPLTCASLHPSGYYMAVGLHDNIKVYHMIHDDDGLRHFHTYDIKKAKKIKFSSGGQYLCAATDKHIYLLGTFSLEQICKLDWPSQQISSLAFNPNDSILSVTSADGYIQKYDLVQMKKNGDASIKKEFEHRDITFVHDKSDDHKCVAVGQEHKAGASLFLIDKKDEYEVKHIRPELEAGYKNQPLLRLNGVALVQTYINNIRNLVCVTNRGTVRVV
jgi:WD40 repeat protein